MSGSGTREKTIAAIYQAGMGQAEWGESLDRLARHVSARGVTLDTYDFDASVGSVLASNMAPDPAIVEYNEVYGRSNPLIERTRPELMRGHVFRASDFVPFSEFRRSALYNTVYRKLGIGHVSAISIECDPRRSIHLSVIKPDDASDFSDRELARLESLQSHIQQAHAGWRHLARTRKNLARLTSLWDLVEFAVLVVNQRMEIQFANRAAEDLLRGIPGRTEDAHVFRPDQDHRLARAVSDVLDDGARVRHVGAIGRGSGLQLCATVFRLRSGEAAVLVTDPLRRQNVPSAAIAERFDLTPAESRLVRQLATGAALKQVAEQMSISYETARSQLKSAMAKNRWRRQSEMLSEVFRELVPFGRRRDQY